jgi:hypothetical protein
LGSFGVQPKLARVLGVQPATNEPPRSTDGPGGP